MKKIIKSRIFYFILGLLISGVTVYAVNNWNASEIDFEPTNPNWNVTKVDKALDDLYTKENMKYHSENNYVETSYGNRVSTRGVSKELTKGQYFISFAYAISDAQNTSFNQGEELSKELTCENNNCNIIKLNSFGRSISGTENLSTGAKLECILFHYSYFVTVNDTDSISISGIMGNNDWVPEIYSMEITKIK